MSNFKSIVALLIAIGILLLVNALVDSVGRGASVSRVSALVDPDADVGRIALARRDGSRTELLREDGHWRIVFPYAGRADDQTVLKLLDVLSAPRIREILSEAELLRLGRSRADFALDNPVVTLTLGDGDVGTTVSFGALTPTADGVYAAISGLEGVAIVDAAVLKAVDMPSEGFRRRSLVLSDVAVVSGFDIRGKSRTNLAFVRQPNGWTVSGERASTEKVEKFLGDVFSAETRRFVWPVGSTNEMPHATASLLAGYGLDPDTATTVSLRGEDATVDQISFGKAADDETVYALVQNGSAIVTVSAVLKDAVDQAADAFTDSRFFPVEARQVSTFSLSDGLVTCALSRNESGQWRLESPIAAPAESVSVEAVLLRILALTAADAVSDGGIQVSVMTNAVRARVRRESVMGGVTFEKLRSPEMLRVDPALVKRIVRQGGGSPDADSVLYVRDRRLWNIEKSAAGESADAKGIENVLKAVSPLVARRIEKLKVPAAELDAYGLGEPYLTIAVDLEAEDSVRRNILVGKRTEGGRFATVGSSDAVFVISDAAIRQLSSPIVRKGRP